jgi:arylsulfatase A-like enzyme
MRVIRERYGTHRATPDMWAEITATYYGMISRLDEQFGRVMQKVKKLGLWEKTITMFFTDHGEYLGDHGLIEKWPAGVSDCLAHEPLIVAGAGLPAGVVLEDMAEMVDLLPTVLQFAGIPTNFPHCGRSMAKLLVSGGKTGKTGRLHAFTEGGFLKSEEPLLEQAPYPYDIKAALQHEDTALVGKAVSVRDKEWTYVYRLYEPPELYSRINDPEELHNLAEVPEHAQRCQEMKDVILRWQIETADLLPFEMDPRFPNCELESPAQQWKNRG